MSRAAVDAIVAHLKHSVRERAPKGWRVEFRVSIDDRSDAHRITGFTHRDGVFGEELAASYREAHCVTRELRSLRGGKWELVDEVMRCLDLVMTYLFTSRPAFRIGTKPSPKRLALDRGAMKTQASSQPRN